MTLAVLGTGVKLSHCTWFSVLCIIWPLPFPELHLLPVSLLVTPVASLGFISSFLGILFSLSQETGTCSRCWECISSHFLDGLFFFFSTHFRSQNRSHLFSEVLADSTLCPYITVYLRTLFISFIMLSTRQQLQEVGEDACFIHCRHLVLAIQPGTWLIFALLNKMNSHFVLILQLL